MYRQYVIAIISISRWKCLSSLKHILKRETSAMCLWSKWVKDVHHHHLKYKHFNISCQIFNMFSPQTSPNFPLFRKRMKTWTPVSPTTCFTLNNYMLASLPGILSFTIVRGRCSSSSLCCWSARCCSSSLQCGSFPPTSSPCSPFYRECLRAGWMKQLALCPRTHLRHRPWDLQIALCLLLLKRTLLLPVYIPTFPQVKASTVFRQRWKTKFQELLGTLLVPQ